MSDLIERLRRYEKTLNGCLIQAPYLGEAADEIERLVPAEGEERLLGDAGVIAAVARGLAAETDTESRRQELCECVAKHPELTDPRRPAIEKAIG